MRVTKSHQILLKRKLSEYFTFKQVYTYLALVLCLVNDISTDEPREPHIASGEGQMLAMPQRLQVCSNDTQHLGGHPSSYWGLAETA